MSGLVDDEGKGHNTHFLENAFKMLEELPSLAVNLPPAFIAEILQTWLVAFFSFRNQLYILDFAGMDTDTLGRVADKLWLDQTGPLEAKALKDLATADADFEAVLKRAAETQQQIASGAAAVTAKKEKVRNLFDALQDMLKEYKKEVDECDELASYNDELSGQARELSAEALALKDASFRCLLLQFTSSNMKNLVREGFEQAEAANENFQQAAADAIAADAADADAAAKLEKADDAIKGLEDKQGELESTTASLTASLTTVVNDAKKVQENADNVLVQNFDFISKMLQSTRQVQAQALEIAQLKAQLAACQVAAE